ncbi:HNH endonuclease [Clostridium beijerinckii]|uniref:HNH endonuclease n=1 Tax=Clostridium beijerinckii TaxID=1520 RepID=A0AAW3W9G5_CLOBE|nr:HNH endonuclease [Clostridium beijerinckii]MBC2475423.1 HNH endonuclease [Clostridium beijerinckii]
MKDKVKDKFKKIDIYSYYVLGELEYGQTAHHIEPLKDNWDRRLEIDNLIYLTESNHQKIHKAMEKDKKNKKQIMDMLYELIRRFEQEFKI